jgi:hypothetical protein
MMSNEWYTGGVWRYLSSKLGVPMASLHFLPLNISATIPPKSAALMIAMTAHATPNEVAAANGSM